MGGIKEIDVFFRLAVIISLFCCALSPCIAHDMSICSSNDSLYSYYNRVETLSPHLYEGFEGSFLDSVIIGRNVDFIPEWAFAISSVKKVVLHENITKIKDNSFYGCAKLTKIDLDRVEIIGENAFKLSAVESADLLCTKKIGDFAFANCRNLQTIRLTSKIEEIGDFAFANDSALISCDIPNGRIGNSTFMDCTNLEFVNLKAENCEVLDIGEAAFLGCRGLKEVILPAYLNKISPLLFYGCSNLSEVSLPSKIQIIGESSFYGTGISTIIIPFSVKKIEANAFCGCNKLREVFLCNPKTEISASAFDKNVVINKK